MTHLWFVFIVYLAAGGVFACSGGIGSRADGGAADGDSTPAPLADRGPTPSLDAPWAGQCEGDADCLGAGPCQSSVGARCSAGRCIYEAQAAGTPCGLCMICNESGSCADTPEDDPDCGVLDCDLLDSTCRDYASLTSQRCLSFGSCKVASPESCTIFDDAAPSVVCRPSVGPCDVADYCDGQGACQTDALASTTKVCRAAVDDCDLVERCTGSSSACPADQRTDTYGCCPLGSGAGPLGGTSRPATLTIPSAYDPSKTYPLLIELHGHDQNAAIIEDYLGMRQLADRNGMFVIAPNGTYGSPADGSDPRRFWNATDGCCNVYGSTVDDVGYLRSLICHVRANYSIDKRRVYLIGLSNGAFMAHRMACDAAGFVTAIVSLAGATYKDASRCNPTKPVSMLHIHGTADGVVDFDGMTTFAPGPVPSAAETFNTWAVKNDCPLSDGANLVTLNGLDFDSSLPGAETNMIWRPRSATCRVQTESWHVAGGRHVMTLQTGIPQRLVDWLFAAPTTR